jgi:two-component system phosphate regulon response regulator PhoB
MVTDDGSPDRNDRTFTIAGREFKLSRTEHRLFAALRSQPGRTFTRAELVAAAMSGSIVLERTIDVHVKTLRQKFGQWAAMIQTVRGVGYKFVPLAGDGFAADLNGGDGVQGSSGQGPQNY